MQPQDAMVLSGVRALLGVLSLLAAVAVTVPSPALGADTDKVYLVAYAKFKSGKAPEALKIIRDHFQKVDKSIGRRVIPFDYVTGEWDHVVYFPFDTARMDTVPSGSEWMKALAAQEGGMDQAQKLFQSYLDLVATSKTEIARLPAAWAP
jgi:hypothetical protein